VLLVIVLLTVGVAVFLADRIFIVIPAGHVGALWNRFSGTRVDRVYSEGLNIISPLDRMTAYEVRKQIAFYQLDVLSVEGLTLRLELAIRFRPEYSLVGLLHETIGPDYMIRVVVPQTESVLRKQLGSATAVQIYTNEDRLLTRAMLKAMNEAGRNLVEVEDIIIRTIHLPQVVKTAIEEKIQQRQLMASYVYRRQTAVQEAQRKRIAADGIRDYQALVDETLSNRLLVHQGIQATRDLAVSGNPKTLVIGAGSNDLALPIFLGDMTKRTGQGGKELVATDLASDLTTPHAHDAETIRALSDPTYMVPKSAQVKETAPADKLP
jgi:regulator of protease activity HflC (stomatin/prohibitin superfamily)